MIKIKRLGLIYKPNFDGSWKDNSCLQPTPMIMKDRVRVFVGRRDLEGISRIGYIDFSIDDLTNIIGESDLPVLDVGQSGCFDDNGVVPCAILQEENRIYLYYAGYLIPSKFKFHVFSGLAVSEDCGESFKRHQKSPILDRTTNETCFRVIHSIIKDNNTFKVYYGGGSDLFQSNKPIYDIRYLESESFTKFPDTHSVVIGLNNSRTRVGRPYVIKEKNLYYMFYGFSDANTQYKLEYATSTNGVDWKRDDIEIHGDGMLIDNEMSAYPSIIKVKNKYFIMYNGNEYGKYGIILGELTIDG